MAGIPEAVLKQAKEDFAKMSPEEKQLACTELKKHRVPVWVVDFIRGLTPQEAHPEALKILRGCANPFEAVGKLTHDDLVWYGELPDEQKRELFQEAVEKLEPGGLERYNRLSVEQKREFLRFGRDLEKCWAVKRISHLYPDPDGDSGPQNLSTPEEGRTSSNPSH
jgi:hypothetical protein